MRLLNSQVTVIVVLTVLLSTVRGQQCPRVNSCLELLDKGKPCPVFPLLPDAFPPPLGPDGYVLSKVRPGLYHYSDDIYHSVIVYGRRSRTLVVVDFPRSGSSLRSDGDGGQRYLLVDAVASVIGNSSVPKRLFMVYGHRHLDHIGLAAMFRSQFLSRYANVPIKVMGTYETRNYVLRRPRGASRPPLPTLFVTRKRGRKIRLSKDLLLRFHVIGGHTDEDVLMHVPPVHAKGLDGFVHVADIVKPKNAPFADFTFTVDIATYYRALRRMLKLDFNVLSTGHGILGDKRDVRVALELSNDIFGAARAAQTADVSDIIARVTDPNDTAYRNNAWSFYEIIKRQASECVKLVIRDWGCRLSSVDVFAESLCVTAVTSVILEE